MKKLIAGIFVKLYAFYSKWGDKDAYFSTSMVFAVLIASTLNFFNAIVYYITELEILQFSLNPVGICLLSVIVLLTAYFEFDKTTFLQAIEDAEGYTNKQHAGTNIVLLFMFSTWILAPIIYKLGQ